MRVLRVGLKVDRKPALRNTSSPRWCNGRCRLPSVTSRTGWADRAPGRRNEMNSFADLRLQLANDQIQRRHAEAANERLARSVRKQQRRETAPWSIGEIFGRSLRVLGLAH